LTQTLPVSTTRFSTADLVALEAAVAALEKVSFARRLTQLAGRKIGFAGKVLPEKLRQASAYAARQALQEAMRIALSSLKGKPVRDMRVRHKQLAMASGALGGAFGVASLPFELPVSTTIMLRAIADIARSEGEDLADPEAAFACLEVFALGGHGDGEAVMEGGYLALRGLFAKSVTDAATFVAQRGFATESAPALARLVGALAGRFGVVVSQKTAAQAAPIFGALGGAAVNLAFVEHFQTLAQGHFTVRRLERAYSQHEVRTEYVRIARAAGYWAKESA
jgi:hypothetical protein